MKTLWDRVLTGCAAALALVLAGCETWDQASQLGAAAGVATGVITTEQAKSVTRASSAVGKTFDDITPEQEYYIGRAVGASVTAKYRPLNSQGAALYINRLGQALAMASDKPETFGGYHFMVLESGEVNAFAAPGGFIFVTRGMLACCDSEDALAAVLAHEIGHVQYSHGLKQIKQGRLTSALTILAVEAGKSLAGGDLAKLTEAFEGSIGDITDTLFNKGYSRTLEFQADAGAVVILRRVGYNPAALVDMLNLMKKNLKPGGRDFAQTHPAPETRIAELRKALGVSAASVNQPAGRAARFLAFKAAIRGKI